MSQQAKGPRKSLTDTITDEMKQPLKAVKIAGHLDPAKHPFAFHLMVRSKPSHFHEPHWRGQLCRALHDRYLHLFMAVLLVLDMFLLISSMHVELYHLESEIDDFHEACSAHAHSLHGYGDDALLETEEYLKWSSVSILAFFGLEIVLCIIGEGLHYLKNPMHSLDVVVIALSLYFECQNDAYTSVLLLSARLWRFFRLLHGTIEVFEVEEEFSGNKNGPEKMEDSDEYKQVPMDAIVPDN